MPERDGKLSRPQEHRGNTQDFRAAEAIRTAEAPENEDAGDPEQEAPYDRTGVFLGFVLLSETGWDEPGFLCAMQEKWGLDAQEKEVRDGRHFFEIDGVTVYIRLVNQPLPDHAAEDSARGNYLWDGAVAAARDHRAFLGVTLGGADRPVLERGQLFVKVMAALCRQEHCSAIVACENVQNPRMYEDLADVMQDGGLPVTNWIWVGMYLSNGTVNAYTRGLEVFGKEEMEILHADADPQEIRTVLGNVASFVVQNDMVFRDGQAIALSTTDTMHTVTRSPGVSLPKSQMTLKISWEPHRPDAAIDVLGGYSRAQKTVLEDHIHQWFGRPACSFHGQITRDSCLDTLVIPPSEGRNYSTLVTVGMGARRMNVPGDLAEYELERAELVLYLDPGWVLDADSMKDKRLRWPVDTLMRLAQAPFRNRTWLGWGNVTRFQEPFAPDTDLCACLLIYPRTSEESRACVLPGGEKINFYQVVLLYRDEADFAARDGAQAMTEKLEGVGFVVRRDRPDVLSGEPSA